MAESFIPTPPNMEDNSALKRTTSIIIERVNELLSKDLTTNPKQGAIEDLKIDDENLKDIESKINQILLALRKSNIISG